MDTLPDWYTSSLAAKLSWVLGVVVLTVIVNVSLTFENTRLSTRSTRRADRHDYCDLGRSHCGSLTLLTNHAEPSARQLKPGLSDKNVAWTYLIVSRL